MTLAAVLLALAGDPEAPRAARLAAADAADKGDVVAQVAAAAHAIVQLESALDALDRRAKALREALLDLLVDSGAPSISTGTHVVGYSTTARPVVTDKAALPARFLTPREPSPDLPAIKRALEAGEGVPGAALGNARPALFIRTRRNP